MTELTPSRLREIKRDATVRPFDLATQLGLSEAALVEAELGFGATRIDPTLGRLFPAIQKLGEVMALTRNRSCVIEKVGTYNDFHDGEHAAMTLDAEIDMRMFPRHWAHAYAVETEGKDGFAVRSRFSTLRAMQSTRCICAPIRIWRRGRHWWPIWRWTIRPACRISNPAPSPKGRGSPMIVRPPCAMNGSR